MSTHAAAAAAPVLVQGYVEAVTDRLIVGWAWSPKTPDARLRIVLRDGDAVLETATADRPRPDLAQNGVGDGAHAFTFELDPAWAARTSALEVIAIGPDESETMLGPPPAQPRGSEESRRLLEGLAASQRVLHRNLQALLLAAKAREPLDAAIERIGASQQALDARTADLETFIARLDERLAAFDRAHEPPPRSPWFRLALGGAVVLVVGGFAGVAAQLMR